MDIVKVLSQQGAPMSLGDIATSTGMQPAKAHRYLVSLIRSGMVQRFEHSGGYELGPFALEFSLAFMAKLENRNGIIAPINSPHMTLGAATLMVFS